MFNFYVILAGYDMVTDANMTTTCRRKFEAPTLQTKSTKNGVPSGKEFHGKTIWRYQTK